MCPSSVGTSADSGRPPSGWTFLTNHSHVLLCLARDARMRVRDVADAVGITERAVQKIIQELESGGILTRQREGRRNAYQVNRDLPLRHSVEAHCRVGQLIDLIHRGRARSGGPQAHRP